MTGGPNNSAAGISSKRSKPVGSTVSKLFNKFDSDRRYDPFLDKDRVIQDSKEGMETLLSMCNTVEINSLFGALGFVVPCPRKAKEQQVMEFIRDGGQQVGKKFADVLKLFWEGLLFEYLRSVGCPLRDGEHDPRHFVMRYWRRSLLDPSVRPGFVPFYLKREVKKRNSIMQEDRDIRDIRAGLMMREELVKNAEARVRGQHDYRFVLQYFSASRDLHRTLVTNVNYLANEVEQLRANVDHSSESISIMRQQFVELETKYDRVVGGLVCRGAFQLTVEGTLYSMINESHVNIKVAERMANELLIEMEVGPNEYDDARDIDENAETYAYTVPSVEGEDIAADSTAKPPYDSGMKSPTTLDVDERTWAAPRSQGHTRLGGDTEGSAGEIAATAVVDLVPARTKPCCDGDSLLESCLEQVRATHRKACARYSRLVAKLEHQNAVLNADAAEACRLKEHAVVQAKEWEARHDGLQERLALVESRSKAEITLAENRRNEERSRALEATASLKRALERVMPTLATMVTAFNPKDTEELGVDLLRKLRIEPDLYAHLLATKRMFEADLESRAFEILDAERRDTLSEAESVEKEDAAGAGGSKKKERGRPKSRGKGGGGAADKGKRGSKSKSKSRSKSGTGRGGKTADKSDKAGGTAKGKAVGKGNPKPSKAGKGPTSETKRSTSAAKDPSDPKVAAKAQRSPSPAKKGGSKGNKKKK